MIHGKVTKHGFESNTFARNNNLIYFHANCGDIRVISALFDEMVMRDIVPWSALTAAYARGGDLGIARQMLNEMTMKDLVSWNVLIMGYAKRGVIGSWQRII